MADIITLNVGGHLYTTTKSTLGKYPDSMLGIMMDGKFDMNRDSNGHPFIDRDGEMFKYILTFLRSTHLALPTDFKHLELLSVEADFYQIQPLLDIIHQLKVKDRPRQRIYYLRIREIERGGNETVKMSGRKEILLSLPDDIIGIESRQQLQYQPDFTELWLEGTQGRDTKCTIIRLSEALHSRGWKLLSSVVVFSSEVYYQLIHTWCLEPSISSMNK